jgi:hypothetical protein
VYGASPKIHVHTPLTQPQNPSPPNEEVELGLGLGLAVLPGVAEGAEDAGGFVVAEPVGVGEPPAATFFAAFAEGVALEVVLPEALGVGVPVALGVVDGLVVGLPAESDGQTVGNGRVGEALGLAARAGAATNAPATRMARALGTAMAVARRRE